MFKRRNPLTFLQHARQSIWPKMGWWRFIKYYRARIIRMSSSAESIAVNMAGGSAMSFTPFFGIHIFGAMGFAWLIGHRMNIIAATVGTFVGNPWTFPFLFYTSHRVGAFVMSLFTTTIDPEKLNPDLVEQHADGMFAFFWDNFADIFVPTAIGGTLMAMISYPFYYMLYVYFVRGAQRARRLRMKKKQRELFNRKSKGEDIDA